MNRQNREDEFKVRIPILYKMVLSVTLLIFAAVVIITYVSVKTESRVLKEGLIVTVKNKAHDIAFDTKSAFSSLNWIFLEKTLRESIQSEFHEIIYSKVVKPDGEVYLASDRAYYGEKIDSSLLSDQESMMDNYYFPKRKEHGMLLVYPTTIQNDVWYIIMGVSLEPVNQALMDLITENMVWASLIVLLGIACSFFLSKSISQPIINLANATNIIANGNWDHTVNIQSKDEVGLLNHSFNRMIKTFKAARGELEKSELRYRSLVDTASRAKIGIAVIQNDGERKGVFKYVNDYMIHLSGYRRKELLKMSMKDLISPDNNDSLLKMYTRTPDEKDLSGSLQTAGINKRGQEFPIAIKVGMTEFEGRRALVCYIRDISEKIEADEKLKDYSRNLEKMVEDRTHKLQETQNELIKKAIEAGRAQLSAMVLHNIGNAITPMKVHLEEMKASEMKQIPHFLEKCYLDLNEHITDLRHYINDDPRGREVFSYMGILVDSLKKHGDHLIGVTHAIDAAVSYISEILNLQHAYAAKEQETKERIDLNRLIEDSIRMQSGLLERRGIIINEDLAHNIPKLLIDKDRLMQVMVNLIKNSYEAIDELNDGRKEKVISIESFEEDGDIGFQITDNGIGIEPEEMEVIFELGKSHKGSPGFGLYYCKMFVEANKGRLTISSVGRGKGTTVRVSFQT